MKGMFKPKVTLFDNQELIAYRLPNANIIAACILLV